MRALSWMVMVWLLALVSLSLGCNDDSAGGEAPVVAAERDAETQIPDPDAGPPLDAASEVVEVDLGVAPDVEVTRPHHLVIEGAAARTVFLGQVITLRVRYIDPENIPVVGGALDLALFDMTGAERTAEGVEGTALDEVALQTDDEGRATFELMAGQAATVVQVQVSAEDAVPLRWRIEVAQDPVGGLTVRVLEAATPRYAAATYHEVRVALYDAGCEALLFSGPDADAPVVALPSLTPFDGDDVTSMDTIAGGLEYAAVATAMRDGIVLARGCAPVVLEGGLEAEVSVVLAARPLSYKGRYEVVHNLDLTAVLSDGDAEAAQLAELLDVLGAIGGGRGAGLWPRGDGIIQLVCDRAQVDPAVCAMLRVVGAQVVEEAINDFASPEVLQVLDALGDLYRVMAEMQVLGEMEFLSSAPDAEGMLRGNESRFTGLRFVWRWGQDCPADDLAACTRTFSLVEAGADRRTIVGGFDAQVLPGDELHIFPHQMQLHLGRVALALLEAWILPEIMGQPGPVGLDNFFSQLLSCDDINLALPPNRVDSGVCEDMLVAPLAELLRAQILALGSAEDLLTFEGQVRVADVYPDLSVDRLRDGRWDIAFGADEQLVERAGTFEGCRIGQCGAPAP